MRGLIHRLERELSALRDREQLRVLRPPRGHDFCSNDYLALARHPQIIEAVKHSVEQDGYGATSSRFIRGENASFHHVQKRLAHFKGCESALLFSSGYAANLGALSSLIGKDDLVFSDALNHASIIDGLRLSGATINIYPHLDVHHLKNALNDAPKSAQKFLVTESLFSMDGDIAPLDIYADLAQRYETALIVDECHAVGLYGHQGAGLVNQFGIDDQVLLSINGLGKAFGCYGGFVAGENLVIDYLVQKARTLMFTTALPPLALAAIDAALNLVMVGDLQAKFFHNVSYLSQRLTACGLLEQNTKTPIFPIILKENGRAKAVAEALKECGYDIKAIRPPTVPEDSARLRITANIAHSHELMDGFIAALKRILIG
jgi:8-amino-7-oxononanoate synthase